MKKIAIFGGTFNPIHNGHVNLCLECQKICDFDKIIFIPTNIPPHKTLVELAPNKDRYAMIELAISSYSDFMASDIEFELGKKSYTINTIIALKKAYPTDEFFLIIGSDMFATFHNWYRFDDILKEVRLVVGARHECEFDGLNRIKRSFCELSDRIDIINANVMDISSTTIRKKVKDKESLDGLVDKRVADYIKSHNLYYKG